MAWKQIKKANPNVPAVKGLCLNYARRVFGVGAKYPYAWTAWSKSGTKHQNRNFPKGVAFPVWFSYRVGGINAGHVAVYVPDKGVYSSPIRGRTRFTSLSSLEEWASNIHYVGWSEGINGVRVVQSVKPKPKPKKPTAKFIVAGLGDTVDLISKQNKLSTKDNYRAFRKLNPLVKNVNRIKAGRKYRVR